MLLACGPKVGLFTMHKCERLSIGLMIALNITAVFDRGRLERVCGFFWFLERRLAIAIPFFHHSILDVEDTPSWCFCCYSTRMTTVVERLQRTFHKF